MRDDALDRIFMSERDDILPSSGFVGSVMEAVRSEAATPPPIPFPWKRALPGLAADVLMIVWLAVVGITRPALAPEASPLATTLPPTLVPILEAGAWIVLTLLLTLAAVMLSMRLVSGTE
jgi:hypothetical protein